MKSEDLELILRDAISALPDNLSGGDVASLLASLATSYAKDERQALRHLHTANHLILFSGDQK